MDFLADYVASKGLDGVFLVVRLGFHNVIDHLTERFGREVPARYPSVSAFWYEGVDEHQLAGGALVEIRGVLSSYVPATPRHPRSVPGRQIDYWIGAQTAVENFAQADFFLWNDGILALPTTLSRKGILGLHDKYGFIGQGGLPIICDLNNKRLKATYIDVESQKPHVIEAIVRGRLINFMSPDVKALGFIDDPRSRTKNLLPSFAIEAYSISLKATTKQLTGTVWMGRGSHNVTPIYCDVSRTEEHLRAIAKLNQLAASTMVPIRALYDGNPITPWRFPTPPLNEQLLDDFRSF